MTVPCANPRMTLNSLLASNTDRDPSPTFPSPRLVQAVLVDKISVSGVVSKVAQGRI